ncbi:mobile mystery protein B [Bradyrhizobium sp. HKCCYLS2058]|uniref:mobile mystery protein B n=1 Tax=Bradyrhizobium TaxID=374 RepID=UPI001553CB54|nr:mobile mystery protein B [Bradyrhizobium aeschynomenes]NPV24514.1 mobile mystery protein B [Bradyrhizobium aeschynomenes]
MTDLFQEPNDATPLAPEERAGLLQAWITNRQDLNEAEEANIIDGAAWARRRRGQKPADLLTEDFVKNLHKQMLGDVWDWAGTYRQTERNIGIDAFRIPTEVPALLDDVRFWVENKTYPPDEIAVRLHHRLVAIHPFPNGNGRHARLMADLLIERLGGEPFSWGGGSLADVGTLRARYVAALQAADNHDIGPLLEFARS